MHREKLVSCQPAKMIDVLKGFIIIAHKNSIIYFNANKFLYSSDWQSDQNDKTKSHGDKGEQH